MLTVHRDLGTLRFFSHHRWLLRGRTRPRALHALRFARAELTWTHRELAETRRALRPTPSIPGWWLQQAACIRSHEGAWTSNTGNGYYGAYQFLLSTWQSVGGRGYPHQASPAEQTRRAYMVWKRDGGSWAEWGTKGLCGLS